MILTKIKSTLEENFPDFKFQLAEVEDYKYDIVEVHLDDYDHEIIFRQCIAGGIFDELEEEDITTNSIEIVNRAIEGYEKLDRANIIKEKKMIKILDQMDATSFHKLTEEELEERMERYKLTDKDFKKKED